MKSRSAIRWGRFLIAVAVPFAAGCVQEAISSNEPVTNSAVVGAVSNVAVTNAVVETNAVVPSAEEALPDISTAEVKPIPGEKPLPHNIRSNSPVADIMKLADSGVDQSVMLAFVTNSTSTFSLTADDIIYLKDIGVPGVVITAILEHDRNLQSSLVTNTWQPQTPPPTETAAPPPEEMAPQVAQAPPPAQESAAPPPSQVTYNNFYSSLSPYGTWVDVEGYGRCWQPTVVVVNPTWQPYSDCGRWVYTDYGWYWSSEYSWGWAPFHYGRWFRHYRLGWCWYPDTIWGPSWVTWRYTDAYCGWAPLPPCAWYSPGIGLTYWGSHVGVSFTFGLGYGSYCFVSWNNFCGSHPHDHVVHHGYNKQIYDRSVVATRISGARNNVFNHGVPVERVERATGTTLNRVAVHEVTSPRAGGLRPERLSSDGRSLVAYRPRMPEGKRELPAIVRERNQAGQTTAYVAGGSASRNLEDRNARPSASGAVAGTRTTVSRPDQGSSLGSSVSRPVTATPSRLAEVTERDLTPQRPVPAASLDRSSKPTRLPEGWGRTQNRDAVTSSASRPGLQPNPASSTTRAELNQPGRNVESTRPNPTTTQRSPTVPQYRPQPQQPQQQQNVQVPRYTPAPNTTYQQPRPAAQAPQYSPTPRTEVPRYTAPAPTYQSPAPRTYTAPQPSQPSYQAPRTSTPEVPRYNPAPQREYRSETPRYTAPSPAPERSYTAPAQPAQPRYSSPPAQSGGNSGNSNTRGDRQSR